MLDKVFEDVLRTLNLARRNDPMTEMAATKIVEVAAAGMRDSERFKALTIQAFTQQQQKQIQRKPARHVPWRLSKLLELRGIRS